MRNNNSLKLQKTLLIPSMFTIVNIYNFRRNKQPILKEILMIFIINYFR